jgi:Domain of unknown function (DUF3303)
MLFVALCSAKAASTTKERIARRVNWKPHGRVVGEYWLQSNDPTVVMVLETDDVATIMRSVAEWDDVFDITVFPAMTAERGLQLAKEMTEKAAA